MGLRESIEIKNEQYLHTKKGHSKEEKHIFFKLNNIEASLITFNILQNECTTKTY